MNITKETEQYIQQHPSIKDALQLNMINFSKLSRAIQKELGIKNFEAVVIACRRFKEKLQSQHELLEKRLSHLLSTSKMEIRNKVMVVVMEKNIYFDYILDLEKSIKKKSETYHVIQGSETITLITSESFIGEINKYFKKHIIKTTKGLIEITLKTEDTVEDTPGWVAYLATRLAEKNVNIIETMSAWTETIFVLHEKDTAKAMELLK